ncbi:MAG TPA: 2'-5' RNA ligase family protein [Mycobacteriales bacterium]|nr:2'-5' RNA ligase family protein [Mycobacteriales bacterium]
MSHQPNLTDATTVRDHWWWRPGWHLGQRGYTWHLTFTDEHDLARLARQYHQALANAPQVDPVPVRWLHLTMQNVGFVDDVTPAELEQITDAAREQLADVPPFTMTFHRPVLLPEAVALVPDPAEYVHQLRGTLRHAIAKVRGAERVPDPDNGYRAHLSVGYINADGPAEPLLHVLRNTTTTPATVTVHAASLIELNRDQKVYRWRTVAQVPLGGTA